MIGYHFVKCRGLTWRDNQGGLFPLSPPPLFESMDLKEARQLMRDSGALFVRWESDFDRLPQGKWWHVIKDEGYDLADLSANTRSKVRRGLKVYCCKPLTRDEVLSEGHDVYVKAFSRYATHERQFSRCEFEKALRSLPKKTEFWGVREKDSGLLVAFSENYVETDVCFYNTIWFDPDSLRKYSSYALFYEMSRYYLEGRSFRYVSDGARSLSHGTEIHDFLIAKFGFRKAYARLHVTYTPWLGVLVKAIYPFRFWIARVPLKPFKKATILLSQETCRRAS